MHINFMGIPKTFWNQKKTFIICYLTRKCTHFHLCMFVGCQTREGFRNSFVIQISRICSDGSAPAVISLIFITKCVTASIFVLPTKNIINTRDWYDSLASQQRCTINILRVTDWHHSERQGYPDSSIMMMMMCVVFVVTDGWLLVWPLWTWWFQLIWFLCEVSVEPPKRCRGVSNVGKKCGKT